MIGVSGASGAPIALAVLRALHAAHVDVALIITHGGSAVLKEEAGIDAEALHRWATAVYADDDFGAPIASGSRKTLGMAVVPCSSTSVAKIALGLGDTLLTRAAHVHLKERRRLVLVPRETPMDATLLGHLTRLAELGATVLVATPAYYTHPKTVDDITNFLAGRVLDQLGVPHHLYLGWKEPSP